jgi:FkbM family methyltransferase
LYSRAKRAQGAAYASLLTRITKLNGSRCHCEWDGTYYTLTDADLPGRKIYFRHEFQGLLAYQKGLKERANVLSMVYMLEDVPLNDGHIVLDCGANVGDFRLCFDQMNVAVRFGAFEPSPVEFSCLKKNLHSNDQAHNIGLWNEPGEMKFFVSSQGADSSLIRPTSYDEEISVRAETISNYLKEPVQLLKLEAEGAEPEILEGAGGYLENISYISADLGFERGVRAESTIAPVSNYLITHGFEFAQISRSRLCALFRNKNA